MKYNGANKEGFDRDARILLQWRNSENTTTEMFEGAARELAEDFGIPTTDIWDYLAEIDNAATAGYEADASLPDVDDDDLDMAVEARR